MNPRSDDHLGVNLFELVHRTASICKQGKIQRLFLRWLKKRLRRDGPAEEEATELSSA